MPKSIAQQCSERWSILQMRKQMVSDGSVTWSEYEKAKFSILVEKLGRKWDKVSAEMPGKSAMDCSKLWRQQRSKAIAALERRRVRAAQALSKKKQKNS